MTSLSPHSRRGLLLISARRVLRIAEDEPADAVVFCETVLSAAFVFVCGVAIWLVLNAGTLLFGIYVTPVWRPAARFHVLFLPGRIPIVVIAMPILIAFAFWRSLRAYGPTVTAAPVLITVALGLALLSGVILLNRYRRKLNPWPLSGL